MPPSTKPILASSRAMAKLVASSMAPSIKVGIRRSGIRADLCTVHLFMNLGCTDR